MNENTFWSDTMTIVLSDNMQSYIELPLGIAFQLGSKIQQNGYEVSNFEKIPVNSPNIRDRAELFINTGADVTLVDLIEDAMQSKGLNFERHGSKHDHEHLDLQYDLLNVSVWQ